MSDQKLRDLERRWKETGSPDDEAAYLLERVRVGDLSRERLELAAYCGHEGARRAAPGSDPPDDWRSWAQGLSRWAPEVAIRAYVVAYERVTLPTLAQDPEMQGSTYPIWGEELIQRLRRYLLNPTKDEAAKITAWDARCGLLLAHPTRRILTLHGEPSELLKRVTADLTMHALTTRKDSTQG